VSADPLPSHSFNQRQGIIFGHQLAAVEDIDEHLHQTVVAEADEVGGQTHSVDRAHQPADQFKVQDRRVMGRPLRLVRI
jgi:hypothetical protein